LLCFSSFKKKNLQEFSPCLFTSQVYFVSHTLCYFHIRHYRHHGLMVSWSHGLMVTILRLPCCLFLPFYPFYAFYPFSHIFNDSKKRRVFLPWTRKIYLLLQTTLSKIHLVESLGHSYLTYLVDLPSWSLLLIIHSFLKSCYFSFPLFFNRFISFRFTFFSFQLCHSLSSKTVRMSISYNGCIGCIGCVPLRMKL
jgi:hypothetical protein